MPPKSYIDEIAMAIHLEAHPDDNPFVDLALYRYYAVLALAKGAAVTNEDVHNAWAAWCSEYEPGHRSLIPYKDLPKAIQDLDAPYTEAIKRAAENL